MSATEHDVREHVRMNSHRMDVERAFVDAINEWKAAEQRKDEAARALCEAYGDDDEALGRAYLRCLTKAQAGRGDAEERFSP